MHHLPSPVPRKILLVIYSSITDLFLIVFFYLLYLESGFLSVAYLKVANLARLGILVYC